ncbi:MAG TPA: Hsp20/alpha crystallin family protein [Vicinamibacterales bacterium]|nr:Hsp20/alpha crystallin family protein [Vicinamibacterales bacterium]
MAFTRWDPLQDLLALHERMNRLARADEPGWMPPVDLYETADRYVITAEVSGLSREDIDIQVRDGKLLLRGERPPREPGGERFERVERGHGKFARAFVLPQAVDVTAITADLSDGVLTIEVPKADTLRRIEVE